MIIGNFTETNGAYYGLIAFLGGIIEAVIKPQERGPDYRVSMRLEAPEFGAAWKKTSKAGKPYLSVKLDSPLFPEPINCALIEQLDQSYALVWNRTREAPDAGGA